jgi:hypothetical protein
VGILSARFTTAVLCAALLTLAGARAATAADAGNLEYAIKGTYLYKFGAFVEWPPAAFADPAGAAVVCIVGPDPFGPSLDKAVSTQRINGRPIVIKRLAALAADSGCHILFVNGDDPRLITDTLNAVRGSGVLTITDDGRNPATTGIINFILAGNRVRFQIDGAAASASGLSISSKLLDLAQPGGTSG